jgi:hypothetical protein
MSRHRRLRLRQITAHDSKATTADSQIQAARPASNHWQWLGCLSGGLIAYRQFLTPLRLEKTGYSRSPGSLNNTVNLMLP